tara:strand:+ start:239 stop:505 length:267 start_codon:yes stop_codon:yes gene_type:complete
MKWMLGRTRLARVRQIVAEEYNVLMSYGDDSLMEDDDRIRALLRVRFLKEGYGSVWMLLLLQVATALIKFWLDGGFEEAPPTPVEGEP